MILVNCAICNKEIYRHPYRLKTNLKSYCNRECFFISKKDFKHTGEWKKQHSEKMRGSGNPAFGKKLPEERKRKISKSLIGKYYGEDHPNWRGGKKENIRRLYINFQLLPPL